MKREYYSEIPDHINYTCGFCNKPVNLSKLSDSYYCGNNGEFFSAEKKYYSSLFKCPNCKLTNLIYFGKYTQGKYYISNNFPKFTPESNEDIPDEIENDRFEAWNCYNNKCYKAAAIMARAALQRTVRFLQAKDGSLYSEISDLRDKGIITKQLADFAHEVRITGNDLAHPSKSTQVSKEEIEESLEFIEGFLQTTIVLPEKARLRKEKRLGDTEAI